MEYFLILWLYYALQQPAESFMSNDQKTQDDGIPKFGKLLIALFLAVVFCGALTWVMGTYFPNFPGA